MLYRRKIALALLQIWGGRVSQKDFPHLLFLFTKMQAKPAYEFVPGESGCVSLQALADKNAMVAEGRLKAQEEWVKADEWDYLGVIAPDDKLMLVQLHKALRGISGAELAMRVYSRHPYYALNSAPVRALLGHAAGAVQRYRSRDDAAVLFTIGYEGRSLDGFLNTLAENDVRLLCDVRKNAFSLKYGFSKPQLEEALAEVKIEYLHLPQLGIDADRRKNAGAAGDPAALFEEYGKTTLPAQRQSVDRVLEALATRKRMALMCFENDPCMCHRGRLADAIEARPDFRHFVVHLSLPAAVAAQTSLF